MLLNFYVGFSKEFGGEGVVEIRKDDDPFDPGRDEGLRARRAGHISDIRGRLLNGMPAPGRLDQGVHLRVDGTDAVIIDDQASDVFTMFITGNGAVVAGGDDIFVFDQDTAAVHSRAGRTFRSQHG